MRDERVWLTYPPTGGFFHAPIAAVPDWQAIGWVPCDPPPEVNLATVHRRPKPAKPVAAKPAKKSAPDLEGEPKNG